MRHRLTSPQRPPRRGDERGASAVEFALVVPFLMLIIFGIIVYGMVFAQALSLSNAARQAARSGVIEGPTCGDITKTAHQAAGTMGMSGDAATVSIQKESPTETNPSDACPGDDTEPCAQQADGTNIYVTLTYKTSPIVPFIPVPSQITGKGVYRCEFK